MSSTTEKANRLLALLGPNIDVSSIKSQVCASEDEWYRISAKAYQLHLQKARKHRKENEKKPNVACTTNDEIIDINTINSQMADFALCLPSTATMAEFKQVKKLLQDVPENECELIVIVESAVLNPRIRASQKKGRFEHFVAFKSFVHLIEAATICYYRENYFSSYLTLLPVVEGVILRWSGYSGQGDKPEFEEIRKFFSKSHTRQPCPGNPLFHDVFAKACDKIINDHLYKPSQRGVAHANFNRHLATHLLNDSQFATKENCIRLFLLIDIMTELFLYETYCGDPRFDLSENEIAHEYTIYQAIKAESKLISTPEKSLLGAV
jgi:hypothetical protein